MKFKVGDRFQLVNNERKTGTITSINKNGTYDIRYDDGWDSNFSWSNDEIIKIGGSMSNKYEELKQRIEALDDGWNEDANELIGEIIKPDTYCLSISVFGDKSGSIKVFKANNTQQNNYIVSFNFTSDCSSCERNSEFKKALLWLLDNSDIPKLDKKKQDKIEKLQDKVNELQEELNELKED